MRRPLILGGFAASAAREVGALAAQRLSVPFVDLVAQAASGDPAQAAVGSERERLRQLLQDGTPQLVVVGPDTLLERELRLHALERAVVVNLQGGAAERVRREAPGSVAAQLELRESADAEAHARLSLDGASEEALAARIVEAWQRDGVAVATGTRTYVVHSGSELAEERIGQLAAEASQVILVSDRTVFELHGDGIRQRLESAAPHTCIVVLGPGERHKTIASLELIWRAALASGADRGSLVVALGGGVVTDVAGFAAACWMRGVRWVAVPTTLLAMVDASVGGKTAVDLLTAKNAVGAFWQPSAVVCDVRFLGTEPERGYKSALAEVVKTAVIGDAQLLRVLEARVAEVRGRDSRLVAEMVQRCVQVKARVVSRDEREGSLRACLNLGHTVGHALESQGGYETLTHGEAVSLGLVVALRIGERLGQTPPGLTARVRELLAALGLPTEATPGALIEATALIGHDKKRAGSDVWFVVARAAGDVAPVRIGLGELREHVRALAG